MGLEEAGSCSYDKEKGLYKVNFTAENIQLNDGSMSYNNDIFSKMRNLPVTKNSVTYKAGTRNVKAIKVVSSDDNQNVVYAIALTTCPSACTVCYGEYQTYCDDVICRHLTIPKQKFVTIPKRNFQQEAEDINAPSTSKKRR